MTLIDGDYAPSHPAALGGVSHGNDRAGPTSRFDQPENALGAPPETAGRVVQRPVILFLHFIECCSCWYRAWQ
jgi:hypothetical protein